MLTIYLPYDNYMLTTCIYMTTIYSLYDHYMLTTIYSLASEDIQGCSGFSPSWAQVTMPLPVVLILVDMINYVHYMITRCSLYIYCMITICWLHVYIWSLYIHYMITICWLTSCTNINWHDKITWQHYDVHSRDKWHVNLWLGFSLEAFRKPPDFYYIKASRHMVGI